MNTVDADPSLQRSYNLLVILDAAPSGVETSPVFQRFIDKISQVGGTVTDVEAWGHRRIAFPAGGVADDGVYVRVCATAPPAAVAGLDRQLTESGLRLHSSAVRA